MNILRNRYVRVFLSAGVASIFAPKVSNLLNWTIPELTPQDGLLNDIEYASILGVLAGMTAIALAAAFGAPDVVPGAASPPAQGAAT